MSTTSEPAVPIEAPPSCSWGVTSLASAAGRITVLWLAGEVGLAALPVLRAALADGLGRRHGWLVVDLSQVAGCDAAALGLLAAAGRTCGENGVGFAVSGCPAEADATWALLPDADPPVRYPGVTDAVTAIWHERAF